jgi:hypothetical protein
VPVKVPDEPKERLTWFGRTLYGNRWVSALADAAGVSRQAVHDWPPADVASMDAHIEKACDVELQRTIKRVYLLEEILSALRERRSRIIRNALRAKRTED